MLRVYGRVQRVGFRRQILDLAQEHGLSGHAKNLSDGSIEIFIQGEKERLTKFFEILEQPTPPAKITEIKKEETAPNPEIKEFKLVYGELGEELQEGFGAMQTIFADYRNEFKDFRGEFGDFRQEFRDYREEFRDFVKRTDENFKLISEKYGEISEKLTVILETLIKESKETREMLNETMKALKETLGKLGAGYT